jgi:hypothetical protein
VSRYPIFPLRLFSFQKQTVACWPHPHPKEKTKKSSPLEAESVWFEFESPPPPPASTSSFASAIAYTSLLLRLRWLFKSALLPQTLAASATSGSRLSAIRGTCTATSTHSCSDLQLKVERGLLRTRQSWPYVVDSLWVGWQIDGATICCLLVYMFSKMIKLLPLENIQRLQVCNCSLMVHHTCSKNERNVTGVDVL